LDYIKLNSSVQKKKTCNREKRQPTELEEIFANYTSSRRFLFIIYETQTTQSHQTYNPTKNGKANGYLLIDRNKKLWCAFV
jgi:hypothetical protein